VNQEQPGLADLFPDADYRHQMRFTRGPVADFFNPWRRPPDVLEQRRHWLRHDPADCAAVLPGGELLLEEMIEQSRRWNFDPPLAAHEPGAPSARSLIKIGESLETDLLLLRPDDAGNLRLLAGCVCFPSAWSLEEKMGRTLDFIHSVVPGLNEQIGNPIAGFLRRMAPDIAWLRANWGLSRSPELNQHPKRGLPRLDETVTAEEVWLRIEHQALVALPRTGGVLFGIRVLVHPLVEVRNDPVACAGLRRALQTMPEDMARYKGIARARASIVGMLTDGRER
jgi:hypothetical protein